MGTDLDPDATLVLAESLYALASEFAHDANNLVMQLTAGHEVLSKQLGMETATAEELEQIKRCAQNVTTITRDLNDLLERARPDGE
ncbi:MAG: hypothetical protein VX466_15955 [Myxococcota bacterium]|nr:hypothetical protein [Myxococcota bacterium]